MENLESVIIYSLQQHLNLAHPSMMMRGNLSSSESTSGRVELASAVKQPLIWTMVIILRPGGWIFEWEEWNACSAFSHPRVSGGLSGPEILAGGETPVVVSPRGAVCSASRAGAVLCQGANWQRFDERQKIRRSKLCLCMCG